MPDYVGLLLKAVNEYNDDVVESKNALRDLVCVVSEDVEAKNDLIIRSLLYTASQKMRVFGYNYKNNFSSDPDILATDLSDLKNALILENYRSKVRKNNILDKTQKELIDFYQSLETKRMLVSAPTSYGKTFIMREILYLNNGRYNNVLLVFPTVALLRENALNMEELNRELNMGYAMNVVLKIYQSAGLLDELTVKRFTAVSNNYNEHGFRGILAHEISRLRDTSKRKGRYDPKTVDQAYANAFKTQKEIIEHKFPQLLTLFESIFTCAAQKRSCNIDNFSLAKVIRYYETGVRSYLGEQLVEFGFPTDTIREIEKAHSNLIAANAEMTKTYINRHRSDILSLLDGYEQGIYAEAVKSLN